MSFHSQFDAFHQQAAAATGLHDFGAEDYHEPMRLLLADYDEHADFTQFGTQIISGEIIGRLVGRLMTQQGLKIYPAYNDARITKPLVIIGMPRTGTTALHKLLSQDQTLQTLPIWLGCFPMPRPPRDSWERYQGFKQVAQGLAQIYALSPALQSFHPMAAGDPDECRFGFNHSFWSPDCAASAIIPDYSQWVLDCDAGYAYRYYRRVLGLIAGGDSRRWLLKDVCHLSGMDSFLREFPDACIVQTHRDPVTALTSVASLILHLRQLREDKPDPIAHGRMILNTWARALDKAEKIRRQSNPAQFFDVHNSEIHADPIGTIERIYNHFDISITEDARQAWGQRVAADRTSGHGVHLYTPEDFGFTSELVYASVGAYLARYQSVANASQLRVDQR